MVACIRGYLPIVQMLLDYGTNSNLGIVLHYGHGNVRVGFERLDPLLCASHRGDTPMVQLLLAHLADVTAGGPEGNTSLHVACGYSHV